MKEKSTAALLAVCLAGPAVAQMVSQMDGGTVAVHIGVGQTFTATQTAQITKISVRPESAYNGTLLVYNGDSGSGSSGSAGTPVYSQSGVSLAASTPGGPLRDIVFTTPFPITAGSTYSFILQDSGRMYVAPGSPYAGGQLVMNYAEKSVYANYDLAFQVWTAAVPLAAPASIPTLSEWGVGLLSLLLGCSAVAMQRRTKK